MDKKSCKIGLQPAKKTGYEITVKGDCSKLLNDIKENLGEYGRRYFEDRLVFEPEEPPKTALAEEPSEEA